MSTKYSLCNIEELTIICDDWNHRREIFLIKSRRMSKIFHRAVSGVKQVEIAIERSEPHRTM